MKLLNEFLTEWDLKKLADEMDAVLEEYKNLVVFTQLHEGVLDDLGDDLVQKVSEIQKRINVIQKARNIVKRLEKSGGFSKDDAKQHRDRLSKNRKALASALQRTSRQMKEFQSAAKQEIQQAAKTVDDSPENVPQSSVDLRIYGKSAPFLLRKASEGNLNVDSLDPDKYGETYEMLLSDGLIDRDGKITDKGLSALEANRAKRGDVAKLQPRRSAIDDLADLGGDGDDAGDELSFG